MCINYWLVLDHLTNSVLLNEDRGNTTATAPRQTSQPATVADPPGPFAPPLPPHKKCPLPHPTGLLVSFSDVGHGFWACARLYGSTARWCCKLLLYQTGLYEQHSQEGYAGPKRRHYVDINVSSGRARSHVFCCRVQCCS
jgi:hypothetical protein